MRVLVDGAIFRRSPFGGAVRHANLLLRCLNIPGIDVELLLPGGPRPRSLEVDVLCVDVPRGWYEIFHATPDSDFEAVHARTTLVTIHDLIDEILPKALLVGSPFRAQEGNIARALEAADRAIAVSETTKRDLCRLYGFPAGRVDVIYHALADVFRRLAAAPRVQRLSIRVRTRGNTGPLVMSVDEKPSIQALERATGYVMTDNGTIVRGLKSTYKRHGTLNLFAALEVATGALHTATTEKKRRIEFLAFMDEVLADVGDDHEIHVILDNYCIHKKNDAWLAAHPTVRFHFTPTSASWLNQVEIWFGILSRKALRGASFRSVNDVRLAIEAFVAAYGPQAKPFIWRKREVKGSQLRNTIVNLRN